MPHTDHPLNILVFGAHPDDCDLRFGGAAMLYRQYGHNVRFVSLTNGDTSPGAAMPRPRPPPKSPTSSIRSWTSTTANWIPR